ncbi:protease 2-like [Zophobas morio]|uniref:protease 2-like n=1 Tax=Zophobas morio TaxID=2755281 RepID=UPI0030833F58
MQFPLTGPDLENSEPPKAKEIPKTLVQQFPEENFKDTRIDEYYWLRSDTRADQEVLTHLKRENAYTENVLMNGTRELRETLYNEMKNRIKEDDLQPARRKKDYFYYERVTKNNQYLIHCRQPIDYDRTSKKPTIDDDIDPSFETEEILLDENERASNLESYVLANLVVSPDSSKMAFTEDRTGSENYELYIKDLRASLLHRVELEGHNENCSGDVAWGANNVLYYLTKDKLNRPFKLYKCVFTFAEAEKEGDLFVRNAVHSLVWHETDERFSLSLSRSNSEAVVYLVSQSAVTSEVFFLRADDVDDNRKLKGVLPRRQSVEYSVADVDGRLFFIVCNSDNCYNSKLLVAKNVRLGRYEDCEELIPHRTEVKLEAIRTFQEHVVLVERYKGLRRLCVYSLNPAKGGPAREARPLDLCDWQSNLVALYALGTIAFPEESYSLRRVSGFYFSHILRFVYTSFNVPGTVYDYDLWTGARKVKKIQAVLGDFSSDDYQVKRTWATAVDGVKVPVSYCYHKRKCTFPAPAYLDGYGSYEYCNEAVFSSSLLSLLDRGVLVVIAHVRGGGELGRMWYEDGKFFKKHNTWRDFLSCTAHLVSERIAQEGNIVCVGASAGGLLIGALLNECKENTYAGAVNRVGFVDVLTTMSDPSIPLTMCEWEEWGNPTSSKACYEYIKSYSPYDQILNTKIKTEVSDSRKKFFPPILATAGLNDPRVGYWEPAKWVQRLRKYDANHGRNILYRCLLESGHFSKSGRYSRLEELALIYAFSLSCLFKKAEF